MNFSVAYELENDHFLLKNFSDKEITLETVILSNQVDGDGEENEIDKLKCVNLLLSENLNHDDFDFSTIITSPSSLHITKEVVENMVYDDAKNLLAKTTEESTLKSNLTLISKITSEGQRLANVFLQNREVFILNLWKIFQRNLSIYKQTILFQTIDSKDSKKLSYKKLTSCNLEGVEDCTDQEQMLFNDLISDFGPTLNVVSYTKDNGQLVITSTIKTTKIIIMAEVHSISVLQKSCLTGLLNTIDHFVQK